MKGFLRICSVGFLVLACRTDLALAQATAELNGRVTDESDAVLPGVTVTATQTETGFTRTVVTDGTGAYVMPNLPTGPYRLDVSLQGFKSYSQTGIVLQVGATPTINAVLSVGNLEHRLDRAGQAGRSTPVCLIAAISAVYSCLSQGARALAWLIPSTGRCTTTPRATQICRYLSPTRFRSSVWLRAA
jgi:hypothetical protein